jgi:hypothetical protein
VGWVFFIAAFACLFGLNLAAQRSEQMAVTLLFAFGVLIGLAVSPTIGYYASTDPKVVWQAGGATALFIYAAARTSEPRPCLPRRSSWRPQRLPSAALALRQERLRDDPLRRKETT